MRFADCFLGTRPTRATASAGGSTHPPTEPRLFRTQADRAAKGCIVLAPSEYRGGALRRRRLVQTRRHAAPIALERL